MSRSVVQRFNADQSDLVLDLGPVVGGRRGWLAGDDVDVTEGADFARDRARA